MRSTLNLFLQDLQDHLKPSFGTTGISGAFTPNVLVLVCMLFEAFVAHYNSPRFYTELKDHTIPRFKVVVAYSFGASSVVYILITAFGFLTFGANCDGYILNNYSTKDSLATSCRVSIAVAIICTYPVVFIGFRDGVLDLLQVPDEKQTSNNLNLVSFVLLTVVTLIAMVVEDLGLINAVGGGTLATAIVFVFPTLMYRQAVLRKPFDEEMEEPDGPSDDEKREVKIALALMWAGIVMGVIGVWIAIAQDLDTSETESVLDSNVTIAA
jgi:amino acid permease